MFFLDPIASYIHLSSPKLPSLRRLGWPCVPIIGRASSQNRQGKEIPELEGNRLKQQIQETHEKMMQDLLKSLNKS